MEEGENDKGPRCPNCGWNDVRLSMPRSLLDHLIRVFGLVPYRCRSCGGRFYRSRRESHEASE